MAQSKLYQFCSIIKDHYGSLTFNILEVGALPLEESGEPFHQLLDFFPGSRIIAFETEKELCNKLNETAKPGLIYYPIALGRYNEIADFYLTEHPMCSSLYRPNEELLNYYNNLEVAMIKRISNIKTITLDDFCDQFQMTNIDYIKIDVQGAALDIFKGGQNCLRNVLAILSEVEFIHLYENQPLFGDVCHFLDKNKLMFHKFFDLAGRTLKPVVYKSDSNAASQHMWSDALFIKTLSLLNSLADDKLLKLATIAYIYDSADVAFYCLNLYDQRHNSQIRNAALIA